MPDLFKKMLGHNESLFLDVLPLDPEFVPPIIQFRENEQSYVANCLKPLFDKRPGKNVFITGSPGIGKTVAVKAILNELDKETSEIYGLYVNCWKKDSPHKIVLDICEQLDYRFVQNRTTDELVKEISKIINKKAAVIVLDEADKIEDHSILYSLLEDLYSKAIVLITNEKDWLKEIDNRIKSRLLPVIIEFKPYNFDETYKILKKRVEHAFVENVFDKAAFEAIAEKTFSIGDLRTGLFLLKEAGELAETKAARKVELEHANGAIEKLKEFKIRSSDSLEEVEQDVLELVKANSGKTTSEIFEAYKKNKGTKTYRTFLRRIHDLKKARVISTEETTWEGPGKITKVYYGSIKKLSDF